MTRPRTKMPLVEAYMLSSMQDSGHDAEHVYRVLHYALPIAAHEGGVDLDVLTAACLLHDIARTEQFADPELDHAALGGEKAYDWLLVNGFTVDFADCVRHCIQTHRYRSEAPPQSVEAKILFDADKVDVSGAVGIARTLLYAALVEEPLYSLTELGEVSDGAGDTVPSFLQEYKLKMETLHETLYTQYGRVLAEKRKPAATAFYEAFLAEVRECY